jgi:hypothetical protein
MPRERVLYRRIYQLLEDNGPLALPVIRQKLADASDRAIREAIAQACGRREGEVKTLYVKEFQTQHEGKSGAPSPVIAIGTLPDAEMPAHDRAAAHRRYDSKPGVREKRNAQLRARRRKRTVEKNLGKSVFGQMVKPTKPIELQVTRVSTHAVDYDKEYRPLRGSYKAQTKQAA